MKDVTGKDIELGAKVIVSRGGDGKLVQGRVIQVVDKFGRREQVSSYFRYQYEGTENGRAQTRQTSCSSSHRVVVVG